MRNKAFITFFVFFLVMIVFSGCTIKSAIKNTVKAIYKTSVDERPLRHILKDKKLTALMTAKLLEDNVTNLLDVTAVCYFGYPFVIGQCETIEEAQRIMDIAQEVTGKPAVPYLLKKGNDDDCNPAINIEIAYETQARLAADKKIFATNVTVKAIQCQIVLLGVLGSKESILATIDHAKKVSGAKKVQSFLVSTDTGRSWEAVFESLGDIVKDSKEQDLMSTESETSTEPVKQGETQTMEPPKSQEAP